MEWSDQRDCGYEYSFRVCILDFSHLATDGGLGSNDAAGSRQPVHVLGT